MLSDEKTEQLQTKSDLDHELQLLLQMARGGWLENKATVPIAC